MVKEMSEQPQLMTASEYRLSDREIRQSIAMRLIEIYSGDYDEMICDAEKIFNWITGEVTGKTVSKD